MPRKRSPTLTDGELRLMRVLWAKGRATVAEVVAALEARERPAYNTVLTLLRVLERKKYVTHTQLGRAFEYRPTVAQSQVRRRALRYIMHRFFDDSPELLMANLLRHQRLRRVDLDRLKRLLDERADGATRR